MEGGAGKSATKTISVLHWKDSRVLEEAFDIMNTRFSAGLRVALRIVPRDRYVLELSTMMVSGIGPDIMALNSGMIDAYIKKNWIYPIASVFGAEYVAALDANPQYTTVQEDSYTYAPYSTIETYRLLLNADLFRYSGLSPDTAPADLEDFERTAIALYERIGPYRKAFSFPLGEGIEAFRENMEMSARRGGYDHFSKTEEQYDLRGYEAWFRMFNRLDQADALIPAWETLTKKGAMDYFLAGNTAMMIVNSEDYSYLADRMPTGMDVRVAQVPALGAPSREGTVRTGYAFGVNKKTPFISDALVVWAYLFSERTGRALLDKGEGIPFSRIWSPVPGPLGTARFGFEAFLPRIGEELRAFPEQSFDSPSLFEGWRRALMIDGSRIAAVLADTAIITEERYLNLSTGSAP